MGSDWFWANTSCLVVCSVSYIFCAFYCSFVIYRCEKSYMRRRLQESFHLSPAAAAGGSSGFFAAFGNSSHHHLHGGHHGNPIPTISVSVQTEPSMVNMNGTTNNGGLANTAAMLANSGGIFNGNGNASNAAVVSSSMERAGNYATLPHPHHHLQSIHVSIFDTDLYSGLVSTRIQLSIFYILNIFR